MYAYGMENSNHITLEQIEQIEIYKYMMCREMAVKWIVFWMKIQLGSLQIAHKRDEIRMKRIIVGALDSIAAFFSKCGILNEIICTFTLLMSRLTEPLIFVLNKINKNMKRKWH